MYITSFDLVTSTVFVYEMAEFVSRFFFCDRNIIIVDVTACTCIHVAGLVNLKHNIAPGLAAIWCNIYRDEKLGGAWERGLRIYVVCSIA